ncbi:MAG: hypothetical protein VYB09_01130 [Planctomycetota bacterium]|nr:hypothetical protein [Planctomycetota bacterium]
MPILIFALVTGWLVMEANNLFPRLSSLAKSPAGAEEGKQGKPEKIEATSDQNPVNAQQLVRQAAQRLIKEDVLQADIRQRINLYDQQLVGTGQYRHFGKGENKRLRLELKLQAGGQLTSLTQVSDGRHLWTREDLSSGTVLSRIDLRRVRIALQLASDVRQESLSRNWVVLGGLPRLLSSLDAQFQFGKASSGTLGATPVWVVDGHWKSDLLEELRNRFPREAGQLPPHLPDSVRLVLGRDGVFPLFPYEVQYLKKSGGNAGEPIVTLQFRRVTRRVQMDNSQFEYQRGDQVVIDRTDSFLRQVGLGDGG